MKKTYFLELSIIINSVKILLSKSLKNKKIIIIYLIGTHYYGISRLGLLKKL